MLALPIFFVALSLHVSALNDWTVPCTTGKCSYDWIGDSNKKAFSSLNVDGSNQLLSDITQAAGWKVMDCNPNWDDGPHDIRLVCDGTPEQTALCHHVYENGAENMVVRLPQNCGVGPFARVNKTWEPTNQTIPDHIKRELNSRATQVRGMTLDYDFKSIPESKGKLNFAITSSNAAHPVISRRHHDLYRRGRDRYLHRRGLFDKIGSAITSAADSAVSAVTDGAKDAATAVTDGAKDAASAVSTVATEGASAVSSAATKAASAASSVATKAASAASSVATKAASAVSSVATQAASAVTDAGKAVATAAVNTANKVQNATSFNETETGKEIPLKFDKNITLLDTDIQCLNFKNQINAHVHLDVDAHMDAQVKFGYTLVGSVVPFKLDDMAVFASLSGTTNMTFGLGLEATGTLDTFPIQIVKFGLPGLSIPGIAALGPELTLDARLIMDLDVAAQMDIHTNFDLGNINMVFPENKGNSTATSKPVQNQNSIQLSTANSGTDFSGTVQALLIPRFDFGVDLKVVQASVFLQMQVGAEMEMKGSSGNGAVDAEAEAAAADDDGTEEDDGSEDDATDDGTTDDGTATDDDAATADDSTATDDSTDADDSATDDSTDADDSATEDDTAAVNKRDVTATDPAAEDDSSADADDTSAEDTTLTEDDAVSADDTTGEDDSATEDDSTAVADDATDVADTDNAAADDETADDTSADDAAVDDSSADDTDDGSATDDTSVGDDTASTDDSTAEDDDSADDTTDVDNSTSDSTDQDDATADDATADDTDTEDDTTAGDDSTAEDDATADDADTEDDTTAEDDSTAGDDSTTDSTEDDGSATDASPESKPLNGCVRVNAVMDISYGLQGTIEPLFPQQVKIPLFNTKKQLLTKCFGGATPDILDELEQEEATDGSGTTDDSSTTEDDTSDEDNTADEGDTTEDDSATTDDSDTAATRRKRSSLTIRQRRHLASLSRRQSLADVISQAVPQLSSAALNLLVCPGSFFPIGAFSALPI